MPSDPLPTPTTFADVARRIERHPLGDAPPAMRENFAALLLGTPPPAPASACDFGGIACVQADPPAPSADAPGHVLWLHGGGYVFGSPDTHLRAARAFAGRVGRRVLLPRYRLAPEHPWPAPLVDLHAVVDALAAPAAPLVLVGDSAGGHLALVAALALARAGRPPAALVLFSPNTDRTGLSTTRRANDPHDPMVSDEGDRRLARLAFGALPDDDPRVSPVLDDLSLLPPTYVEVGGREVLLGDSEVLAARARAAGAAVTLHVEPEAFHMWQLWTPWLPEANASIERAARFARLHLGAAGESVPASGGS